MKHKSISELQKIAMRVREHILRMSTNGGCFTGASLSCADILVYLYANHLNISPESITNPERDYLFLSKGHDVPALYGTFVELGFIEEQRLENHLKTNDHIYWHPNTNIPGIEFHSGSLGHLLSVAMGVAYDCKLRRLHNRVYVILGDGELNEGSIWEGLLVASAKKLNNLIIIVDRNRFQANVATEELIPIEPLERKFEAFGWSVVTCNGHSFDDLQEVFSGLSEHAQFPTAIIAETIRGKGVPSIEGRADRWFCNFSSEEVQQLINELHGRAVAELHSESLMVR